MKLQNKSLNRVFLLLFISFLLFITINLFFYSLISIGLYKFICYENQSNILENFFYNKNQFIFYYIENVNLFYIISKDSFYQFSLYTHTPIHDLICFYDFFSNIHINYFFYMKNLSSEIEWKKDLNLIFLNFYIRSSNLNWIHSISLQKTIIINFNESSLFFFRIYNPSHVYLKLITLYMIYPNILTLYVNKIQCFCFNTIFLYPLELVDLPVLIYIYPFLNFNFMFLNNIIIYYIIFLN